MLPQIPSNSLMFRIGREIILCRGRADTGAFALRRGFGPRRGGRPSR